jgi:hypothetical protein
VDGWLGELVIVEGDVILQFAVLVPLFDLDEVLG